MSRKFIATIVAGAIAITGFSAAQAEAGNRDLVRLLAGATALVIIGKAISDDNDRRHKPKVITRGHRHHGHVRRPYDRGQARIDSAYEQARQQAIYRAKREEARRQEYLREQRREARREERRRETRREARRNDRDHSHKYSHIRPRPLPDRVRRYDSR
ncbi:hypothetical protein [Aquicoccus porphyridii]|uniref:Uncharacterized protein n=1 Tax=Aquicoccus porphyridii TaxID=1852029 RepID=A0A5A9Z7H1_9RHOB|nr:hypothetical protein [Aquicoccus porphyridii]KAA0913012.1 hypothetical protein FLO80_14405 [Aquicoccus porphyridii]RAI54252.1 hypothetical protein DOO74_08400 [Rhodobacteraceae bacterium AsT-22]